MNLELRIAVVDVMVSMTVRKLQRLYTCERQGPTLAGRQQPYCIGIVYPHGYTLFHTGPNSWNLPDGSDASISWQYRCWRVYNAHWPKLIVLKDDAPLAP